MRFGIYNVFIYIDELPVVREEQIKVFQRFAEKERFHHISGLRIVRIIHVADRRIAAVQSRVFFKSL